MSSAKPGIPAAQIRRFEVLYKLPENRECFDCTARQPRWGSTNLGIFFCLRCAGAHRSLGVHITKVKSSTMDTWEEEMIQRMERIGNGNGKLLYESRLPPAFVKPDAACDASEVERVIRQKYERRVWAAPNFDALLAELLAVAPCVGGSPSGPTPVASPTTPMAAVVGAAKPYPQQQQQQQQQQSPPQVQASAAAAPAAGNWTAFVSSPTLPHQDQQQQPLPAATSTQRAAPPAPSDIWSAFETQPAAVSKPTITCSDLFGPAAAPASTRGAPQSSTSLFGVSAGPGNTSSSSSNAFPNFGGSHQPSATRYGSGTVQQQPYPDNLFGGFKSSPTAPTASPQFMPFGTAPPPPPPAASDHLMDFGGKPVGTQDIMALFGSPASSGAPQQQRTGVPPIRY